MLGVALRGPKVFGVPFTFGPRGRTGSEVCSGIGPASIGGNTGAKLGTKDAEVKVHQPGNAGK